MNENYQPNVPKEIRKRYKKAKMRNFIGYLACQWVHHSNYRSLNNGWFFIPASKLLEETALSYHTVLNYESQLILDGMIEKKTGNFTDRKANEYRCTFMENQTKTATQKTATINCNDGGIENEELNEKTATINFKQNCNTDTDTEIDKETINTENGEINKELVISSDSFEIETTDTSQAEVLVTEEEEEELDDKGTKTENNTTQSINEAYHHFFDEGFEGGIYQKVIKDVASSYESRKTLWERWNIYCKWMKDDNTDISFKKMEQCLNAFLYLIGREYTEPASIKDKKLKCLNVHNSLMKVFFLRQWKRFTSNLDMYQPQDCKKTRLAFFKKADTVYQDDEEREKTVTQMEVEYAEAYRATNRNVKLKYEELDPDLKYQNLEETVTPSSTDEEEEELVVPSTPTVQAFEKEPSDTFNKAYNVWRKLQKNGNSISLEEIENFINWAEKLDGITDHDMEVMRAIIRESQN